MTEQLISLLVAALLLFGSPGPATLALAATGATVGVRRGCPFLLGILAGLSVTITASAVGLASLLSSFGQLAVLAQLAGALYIIYLAVKIATAPVVPDTEARVSRAPGFGDGFILNILNVKAYAVFLAIFSGFLLPLEPVALAYLATGLLCVAVATTVNVVWLWFGGAIRPLFAQPRAARILRIVFAVLMVLSVAWVLLA